MQCIAIPIIGRNFGGGVPEIKGAASEIRKSVFNRPGGGANENRLSVFSCPGRAELKKGTFLKTFHRFLHYSLPCFEVALAKGGCATL